MKCWKWTVLVFAILVVAGCEKVSNDVTDSGTVIYAGNEDYTVRESVKSVNGQHTIQTLVTRKSGIGLSVDGVRQDFEDVALRYSPVISDAGEYAYVRQMKGVGYDIIMGERSVLHSGVCLDYLTAGSNKAICIESDNGKSVTRLYSLDISSGECTCVARWVGEYIEETCRYGKNSFGVITSQFDAGGQKKYNLYAVDADERSVMKLIAGKENLIAFSSGDILGKGLIVDELQMTDNERYLFNALRFVYGREKEAFAHGNDFRGRMSWDQSERLRGLCELYKKTCYDDIKARIEDSIDGILNARNNLIGLVADEWNPEYLWSSKSYTMNGEEACILIENSEILSALLLVCNEGVVKNREIVEVAKKAYNYYEKWFRRGHYLQPYGYPVDVDGLVVPWNYQNSMAEVCLGLWIETGEQKYLYRCNELIRTFMSEWMENNDRIYWHYWPLEFYKGWEDDGRSMHMTSRPPQDDKLFEDASHAGISVRLLSRYVENVPNGVVNAGHLLKIESNMKYFCHTDGFSRFISGDEEYSPRAWHYWISPYFVYLHNANFERYVRQGYLRCFPEWDSQEALFANARLYKKGNGSGVSVRRMRMKKDGIWEIVNQFSLTTEDLPKYLEKTIE